MIVTVTANPSLDRTAMLAEPLRRGDVQRVTGSTVEAGGKGVNVARAIHMAGEEVLALFPGADDDPFLALVDEVGVPYQHVPVDGRIRMNITLTEPDGTTTKLNEPGFSIASAKVDEFTDAIVEAGLKAEWVVLSGSLPPGMPVDWYARVARQLRVLGCRVAVDTSDAPLAALAEAFPEAAPDLIKPNSEELAQLSGKDAAELEAAAAQGDASATVEAARVLLDRGVGSVLATLGGSGAVLVTNGTALRALPPKITVQSTVGAGDSSVAGYVMAATRGESLEQRLATAIAYGSAAASLAGSALPRPDQVDPSVVVIESC